MCFQPCHNPLPPPSPFLEASDIFSNVIVLEARLSYRRLRLNLAHTGVVTTVTQVTMCRPNKLVHVETSTVFDANGIGTRATVIIPVKTSRTSHDTFSLSGMRTHHPSWSSSATVTYRDTRCCHGSACITHEAIPCRSDRPVTFVLYSPVSLCSV